ncbi:hypothetical protein SAY87_010304 [Trapa incisa]|uniref:2-(3-amino-3-carboxypropyl)histidine synthase subunit 2 n=1 Tax=Trapa incisa TaxID=236973 RepID=A0AAN7JHW4_9MYRT|nr:hypothetical protein SAY87_010304 [Trapa incisa]
MECELESRFEVSRTTNYIHSRNFTRVALQFPDELLKYSTKVVSSLRNKLLSLKASNASEVKEDVRFFVMADTTFGSCCVDEVGASHISADCVIHYGHTCLSPTSSLPAFFVFGKSPMDISSCAKKIFNYASAASKPVLVLYGLEYAHIIMHLKEVMLEATSSSVSNIKLNFQVADVTCYTMNPSVNYENSCAALESYVDSFQDDDASASTSNKYRIGGLTWNLPQQRKMGEYLLFWIGDNNSAFENVVLTFNGCEIGELGSNFTFLTFTCVLLW